MKKSEKLKKLVLLAMFAAFAYVAVLVLRFPVVAFPPLKYEPKDVIIVLCGFMMGPIEAIVVSAVVSFIEMITASETGIIGCIMNIVSTVSFVGVASLIYKYKRKPLGAVIGLVTGVLFSTAVMLFWNYMIIPLYSVGTTREAVASILLPVLLPFNLAKNTLNAALTLLIYKPLVRALRRAKLLPGGGISENGKKNNVIVTFILVGVVAIIACVLVFIKLAGII